MKNRGSMIKNSSLAYMVFVDDFHLFSANIVFLTYLAMKKNLNIFLSFNFVPINAFLPTVCSEN